MKLQDILLLEATFNTDELVDYLYDKVYKDYFDSIQKWKKTRDRSVLKPMNQRVFTAKKLEKVIKDKKIKEALRLNPVTFIVGSFATGSQYKPIAEEIHITVNSVVPDIVKKIKSGEYKTWYDILDDYSFLSIDQLKNLENELTGNVVKATIAHEVAHWLDDTFNNRHIARMVTSAETLTGDIPKNRNKLKRMFNRGQPDTYMTDYEINAMIHAIKQHKRNYSKREWDSMTWESLMRTDPSLRTVWNRLYRTFYTIKERQKRFQYYKNFLKRMYRENLLGKNMSKELTNYMKR